MSLVGDRYPVQVSQEALKEIDEIALSPRSDLFEEYRRIQEAEEIRRHMTDEDLLRRIQEAEEIRRHMTDEDLLRRIQEAEEIRRRIQEAEEIRRHLEG